MKNSLNIEKIERTARFQLSCQKLLQSHSTPRFENTSTYVSKFPKHRLEASAFKNRTMGPMALLGDQCYE